jgi:predicted CXXCH cytochrome family protein
MNHVGITGGCATCHNGNNALGKASYAKHPVTVQACETCHSKTNFTAWGPGTPMNHVGIVTGCATCHDGNIALGKASYAKHVPTTQSCEFCHKTTGFTAWGPGTPMNHTGITAGCATCHNGTQALGKASYAKHVPTTLSCETCHSPTNFTAWGPGTPMNHVGITSGCASCHNGNLAMGAKGGTVYPTHTPFTVGCEVCHSPTNFTAWGPGTKMNHLGAGGITLTGGPCATCHNGTIAIPKNKGHKVTTQDCYKCHTSFTNIKQANAELPPILKPLAAVAAPLLIGKKVDHSQVKGTCASCHNGTTAAGKIPTHMPTSATCDACHNSMAWKPVRMEHSQAIGTCASCHTGKYPLARQKPATHIQSSALCESCHVVARFKPAVKVDHTQVSGACSACHNGTMAKGKPTTHVASTMLCASCHTTTAFKPATRVDHTQALGTCSTCHNGIKAKGKNSGHFLTNRQCESCHTTTVFKPSTFRHQSAMYSGEHAVALTCTNCHTGNAEIVPWRAPAFAPNCAACHISSYKPGAHKKFETPTTGLYTASELRDCTGACHLYTDNTLTKVKTARTGKHRVNRNAW